MRAIACGVGSGAIQIVRVEPGFSGRHTVELCGRWQLHRVIGIGPKICVMNPEGTARRSAILADGRPHRALHHITPDGVSAMEYARSQSSNAVRPGHPRNSLFHACACIEHGEAFMVFVVKANMRRPLSTNSDVHSSASKPVGFHVL